MNFIKKLGLREKLILFAAIPLLSILFLSVFSTIIVNRIFDNMAVSLKTEGTDAVSRVLNADRDMYQALLALQLYKDSMPEQEESLIKDYNDNVGDVSKRMGEAKAIFEKDPEKWNSFKGNDGETIIQHFNDFENEFNEWTVASQSVIENKEVNVEWENKFNIARENINMIGEMIDQASEEALINSEREKSNTLWITIALNILVFGFVIAFTLALIISLRKTIGTLANTAEKISKGDTDISIEAETNDEIGKMIKSFKKITERVFWYEQLLDAIPLPISVTDMNMNWTFINKPVEDFIGIKRKEALGKPCSNWNANICRTGNCGIECLKRGKPQTAFAQNDMNYQVDTSYIVSSKGEKIGHIEIVQDITEKARVSEFQKAEVERIARNLKLLSEGILDFDTQVAQADKYTEKERQNFVEITGNLVMARDSLKSIISEISYVLSQISGSNLDVEFKGNYKGEFSTIKDSLNNIVVLFNNIMKEFGLASEQVRHGASQVSDSSQALSQGATEQASAIEQLSSSITQVAAQTKDNAVNAGKANEQTSQAMDMAVRGDNQMKDMVKSMNEINEASQNISKIIKVIDEIAFQTNILALNAAVEAARAGQHGKGFAVVAEEVRNLAARSAEAARETTTLIEGAIKKAEVGTKIAGTTSDTFNQIVDSVEKASKLTEGIAKASNEQATAITQINSGISQVSQVIQTNSATAEEGTAISEQLLSQAEVLKDKVNDFKLKNGKKSVKTTIKDIDDDILNELSKRMKNS